MKKIAHTEIQIFVCRQTLRRLWIKLLLLISDQEAVRLTSGLSNLLLKRGCLRTPSPPQTNRVFFYALQLDLRRMTRKGLYHPVHQTCHLTTATLAGYCIVFRNNPSLTSRSQLVSYIVFLIVFSSLVIYLVKRLLARLSWFSSDRLAAWRAEALGVERALVPQRGMSDQRTRPSPVNANRYYLSFCWIKSVRLLAVHQSWFCARCING